MSSLRLTIDMGDGVCAIYPKYYLLIDPIKVPK